MAGAEAPGRHHPRPHWTFPSFPQSCCERSGSFPFRVKFRIGPSLPASRPAEAPGRHPGGARSRAQSEESWAPAQARLPAPQGIFLVSHAGTFGWTCRLLRTQHGAPRGLEPSQSARALGPQPLRWTSSPRGRRAARSEQVPQTTAQAGLSLRTGDPPGHSAAQPVKPSLLRHSRMRRS